MQKAAHAIRYAARNHRFAVGVSGHRFAEMRPWITSIGIAEGIIIAPIITAHISQTTMTSRNAHSALIGIISATTDEDVFAADQIMSAQPTAESATSVTAPLRI